MEENTVADSCEHPIRLGHVSETPSISSTRCRHVASPPYVAPLGEQGGLDDLGRHPGVGASRAHLGRLVPLPRQAEVRDLQRLLPDVVILDLLQEQN